MSVASILSTRLLESFIIAGVVLGGVILVLKSDIEHLTSEQREQKIDIRNWYKELKTDRRELDDDIQTMKAEFYKHQHK